MEPCWPFPPDSSLSSLAKKLPFRSLTSSAKVSCDVLAAADWNLKVLLGTLHDHAIVACVSIPSMAKRLGPGSLTLTLLRLPFQCMSNDAVAASGGVCETPGGRNAGNEFASCR